MTSEAGDPDPPPPQTFAAWARSPDGLEGDVQVLAASPEEAAARLAADGLTPLRLGVQGGRRTPCFAFVALDARGDEVTGWILAADSAAAADAVRARGELPVRVHPTTPPAREGRVRPWLTRDQRAYALLLVMFGLPPLIAYLVVVFYFSG